MHVRDTSHRITQLALITIPAVFALAQQPAIPSTGFPGLDQYRASRIAIFTDDFGQFARYPPPTPPSAAAPGENRVVFFGDSITDIWNLDEYFPVSRISTAGSAGRPRRKCWSASGKTSSTCNPKSWSYWREPTTSPETPAPCAGKPIEANYASLAELARANHIAVIFSSVLPVHNYTDKSKDLFAQRSPEEILALNRWLQDDCAGSNLLYLDDFAPMVDEKRPVEARPGRCTDWHPNAAG